MKTLRSLSALLPLLFIHTAFSSAPGSPPGTGAPPDTSMRSYTIGEIVVTATRRATSASTAPSAVTVVRRETIDAMPGTLLSAALTSSAGMSLRAYGGGASVETISLRGMSPEHTLVLVDGQRSNSFQNGLADFGIFSSSSVDRVEILRGGASALYGADAVGGVVNVITRSAGKGIHGSASTMLGSSHTSGSALRLEGGGAGFGIRGSLEREQGRGDYKFKFNDGRTETTLTREGEDYSLFTGVARMDWTIGPALRSSASCSYTDADRGSPGVVTDPSSGGKARLADRLEYVRAGLEWEASPELSFRANGSAHYNVEHYDDPGQILNGTTIHSLYTNHDGIITPEVLFSFSPAFSGVAGAEYARASLRSSETVDAVRVQRSAYVSTEHLVTLPWASPFDLIVYPSIRYDTYSDVSGDVSPMLGVNVGLLKSPGLRLRASYGRSFRAPVLNELYWIEGGNPLLKPERAVSFDAGLRFDTECAGMLRFDASYFSIDSKDRIVWVPASGTFWSPKNIASVTSRGAEVEGVWTTLEGALRLTVNATWTDVEKSSGDFPGDPTQGKRLIYEPAQTFNALAEGRVGPLTLLLRHSWVSYRYTTEINDRFLPGYSLESAAVSFLFQTFPLHASVKAEVNNLFNTSYQVVALYPMPLREVRMTLEAGI